MNSAPLVLLAIAILLPTTLQCSLRAQNPREAGAGESSVTLFREVSGLHYVEGKPIFDFSFTLGDSNYRSVTDLVDGLDKLTSGTTLEFRPGCVRYGRETLDSLVEYHRFATSCSLRGVNFVVLGSGRTKIYPDYIGPEDGSRITVVYPRLAFGRSSMTGLAHLEAFPSQPMKFKEVELSRVISVLSITREGLDPPYFVCGSPSLLARKLTLNFRGGSYARLAEVIAEHLDAIWWIEGTIHLAEKQ